MKKLIAALLAAALLAALGLNAAASSITTLVEVEFTATENMEVEVVPVPEEEIVTIAEVLEDVREVFEALLSAEPDSMPETMAEVAALLEELAIKPEDLVILDQVKIEGNMSEETPLETTIYANGIKEGTPMVILFLADGVEDAKWEILAVGTAPSVEVKLTTPGKLVVSIA